MRKVIIAAVVLLVIAIIAWIIWSNLAVESNEYKIKSEKLPDEFDGFRILLLSDLHNASFGKDNARLIKTVREAKPDMIAVTGDIVDSRRCDMDIAFSLAEKLSDIAPVYYVSGNNEGRLENYDLLTAGLESRGVAVLENETAEITINGEKITLIGIADPRFSLPFDADTKGVALIDNMQVISDELSGLEFDGYTVLLSHRPETFDVYVENNIDLALCGHAHGGQFRIPFVGGVFAPGQGLFPKYDAGLFEGGKTSMLVSRGLGNSSFPFRVNNRPEIITAVLQKEN